MILNLLKDNEIRGIFSLTSVSALKVCSSELGSSQQSLLKLVTMLLRLQSYVSLCWNFLASLKDTTPELSTEFQSRVDSTHSSCLKLLFGLHGYFLSRNSWEHCHVHPVKVLMNAWLVSRVSGASQPPLKQLDVV
jgi:hypothetical protein